MVQGSCLINDCFNNKHKYTQELSTIKLLTIHFSIKMSWVSKTNVDGKQRWVIGIGKIRNDYFRYKKESCRYTGQDFLFRTVQIRLVV